MLTFSCFLLAAGLVCCNPCFLLVTGLVFYFLGPFQTLDRLA